MKKVLSLFLTAVFAMSLMMIGSVTTVSAQTVSTESSRSVKAALVAGDIDDSGVVNNRDLGRLQQYLNGWDVEIDEITANVNGDQNVNNRDLGLLQQFLNDWDVELVLPSVEEDSVLEQVPSDLSGTKVNMLVWWTPSMEDKAKAAAFQEKTGIKVAYDTATMDKYQSNLSAKIVAGNPPATAAIINEWYPQPITRGLMQPIENTGWDYSDPIYATNMMEQFSYKGEQYGIALKGSAMSTFEVMFFNKEMMAAEVADGTDPYSLWKKGQWNWETCLNLAKKYTKPAEEKYGLTLISQYYWMLSAGEDFVLSDSNGLKNNIKSAKVLDSWNWAWDMIYTHKVIPTMFSHQQQLFYDGSVAMLGGGSYFMMTESGRSGYVPENCDFDWGVVPFPSPKKMAPVAACEGTVWGFPTGVRGNKLQAAAWYLRYYLDDAAYYAEDELYGSEQCWEVMDWMWNQQIQSYNSVGVLSYGGMYNGWSIQYSVIDEAVTKAQVSVNLHSWYSEIESQINKIETEMD